MYGSSRAELPYDYTSEFPPPPLFIPIPGAAEHDSLSALRSEIGYTSSGCSSYGGSPTPYSPTLMQRSISSLSLHGNMDVYSAINSSSPAYCDYDTTSVRKVLSTGDLQQQQQQQQSPRLNSPLMNESSIIESMSRASPYSPEEKKERIERYRSKRNLRNFNKKIKYECRKTLADSRPRIRGRFARNDETDKAPQTQSQWEEHNQDEDDENWINFIDSFSTNLMP
ncbi:zinc finger protein CO3-like isoform X2 [Salvia splendens]|uniref:zinc finger protein CO3-like isoform X2 n=1 Tax=Salvia splendens TaxID=180675 RepID=UPI001C2807B3|nr:zinc finger protein CO3-like isoform X2 [Salvia splendens]